MDRERPYGTFLPPVAGACFEQDGRLFTAHGAEVQASVPAAPTTDPQLSPAPVDEAPVETPKPRNKGGRPKKVT